jgi:hypothetical protein
MGTPTLLKPVANASKRPLARNRILSARFTDTEFAALESLAWSKGTTIADWAREALLHNLGAQGLEPLLRGDKMAQDQVNILFRQVQTSKAAQAQELLAKRSQNKEK